MNLAKENFEAAVDQALREWFGEPITDLSQRPAGKPAIVIEDPRLKGPKIFVFQDSGMICLTEEELKPLRLQKVEEVGDDYRYQLGCSAPGPAPGIDADIAPMNEECLRAEIMKLRTEIRYHRDQKGDDRCWLDDVKLYKVLPEGEKELANFALPCREKFLGSCKRFWESRQEPGKGAHE